MPPAQCWIDPPHQVDSRWYRTNVNPGGTVNFIADPNEWMTPVKYHDAEWWHRYYTFRFRLHWLLLWNSEVRIFDSFFLFNRQMEEWFSELNAKPVGLVERIFSEDQPAVSVAIRRGLHSLSEVFDRDMLGNREYRWYYDGAPTTEYVRNLDAAMTTGARIAYDGRNFPAMVRESFCGAFERDSSHPAIFEESAHLRETIPSNTLSIIAHIVEGHNNGWRRSILNGMLGFGIDKSGGPMPCDPQLQHLSLHTRDRLRRLVDSCWCRAIRRALGEIPTRYPGQVPPRTLAAFRDDYIGGLGLSDAAAMADWAEVSLLTQQVGCVGVTGDFVHLVRNFAQLSPEAVILCRERPEFRNYRELYRAFDADLAVLGPGAFNDQKRLVEISNEAVRCLTLVGLSCGVKFSADPKGGVLMRFVALPWAPRTMAAGLAFTTMQIAKSFLQQHGVTIPEWIGLYKATEETIKFLITDRGVTWLSMRLNGVGTDLSPTRVRATRATYLGTVAMPTSWENRNEVASS